MIEIREKLLPINKYSRPGRKRKGVKGLEIHWVANANTSARFNRRWFETSGRYGSTHYIVDLNGKIVQMIPENEIAFSLRETLVFILTKVKYQFMTKCLINTASYYSVI